ncbi:hypothetical protein BC833DRAFT_625701 [Globomyces pollinis-pini]|nr:hypothetical protein BC833DRAFT_625701 [Globomyces pollinis-pini]
MPKLSDRQSILQQIDKMIFELAVYKELETWGSLKEKKMEEEIEQLIDLKASILSCRKLVAAVPRLKSFEFREIIFNLSESDLKQQLRKNKTSFEQMENRIKQHSIFKSKSYNKRKPTWVQLAVTLERLGMEGIGVSVGRTARSFGLGTGTVILYSNRVLMPIEENYSDYLYVISDYIVPLKTEYDCY